MLLTVQAYLAARSTNVDFGSAANFLEVVGARLFLLNLTIQRRLLSGAMDADGDRLVSPLAGHPDYNFPSGYTVADALEFDIHMVFLEQGEVTGIINSDQSTVSSIDAINILLNLKYHVFGRGIAEGLGLRSLLFDDAPVTPVEFSTLFSPLLSGFVAGGAGAALVELLNGDTVFVDAATEHLGGLIDFNREEHRVAMGIARVFQEHGLSHEEYLAYMETIEARGYTAPPSIGAPTGGAHET